MKEYNDDDVKFDARIILIMVAGQVLFFAITALVLLPKLISAFMDPLALYQNGLSDSNCFTIALLTTLGLLIYFTVLAGERLLDFELDAKLLLIGAPIFFYGFWQVLAWLL